MWDKAAPVDRVRTITLKGKIFFGAGAVNAFEIIADALKKEGIDRVLIVTGKRSYIRSGAWEVIEPVLCSKGMSYTHFDGVTPNPAADQVDTAAATARWEEAAMKLEELEEQLKSEQSA